VQSFFKTYYAPNNAVLLILGDVKPDEGLALAKKYFGDIPAGAPPPFADPGEPEQTEERRGEVEENSVRYLRWLLVIRFHRAGPANGMQ